VKLTVHISEKTLHHSCQNDNCRGFTLIEVLVALLVLALSMSAITQSIGNSVVSYQRLKEATLSQWVAMNVVAEVQLRPTLTAPGNEDGSEELGGKEWFWKVKVEKTDDPDVHRMRVEVRENKKDENTLSVINAFVGKPLPAASIVSSTVGSGGGGESGETDGSNGSNQINNQIEDPNAGLSGGFETTALSDQFSPDMNQ